MGTRISYCSWDYEKTDHRELMIITTRLIEIIRKHKLDLATHNSRGPFPTAQMEGLVLSFYNGEKYLRACAEECAKFLKSKNVNNVKIHYKRIS